jgi:hypothetical protein
VIESPNLLLERALLVRDSAPNAHMPSTVRNVKRSVLVIALLLVTASSATAAPRKPWAWTETFTEQRVKSTLYYRDAQQAASYAQGVRDAQAAYDQAQRQVDLAKQQGDPGQLSAALQLLGSAEAKLRNVQAGDKGVYRPLDVTCFGTGPSYRSGFAFAYFRCRVQFAVGLAKILVHVTGPRTFTYRTI